MLETRLTAEYGIEVPIVLPAAEIVAELASQASAVARRLGGLAT